MLKNLKVIALLISILGLTFACTLKESNETSEENPVSSSISVTLKITNAADFEDCSFIVSGTLSTVTGSTLNTNYLSFPKTNSESIQITVSKGKLQLEVQAVKKDGSVCGIGSVSEEVTKKCTLEVKLDTNLESITVAFNSNGGSDVTSKTVIKGLSVGTLPTPSKENFQFEG